LISHLSHYNQIKSICDQVLCLVFAFFHVSKILISPLIDRLVCVWRHSSNCFHLSILNSLLQWCPLLA
jgi:hypothetical protein